MSGGDNVTPRRSVPSMMRYTNIHILYSISFNVFKLKLCKRWVILCKQTLSTYDCSYRQLYEKTVLLAFVKNVFEDCFNYCMHLCHVLWFSTCWLLKQVRCIMYWAIYQFHGIKFVLSSVRAYQWLKYNSNGISDFYFVVEKSSFYEIYCDIWIACE